MTPTPTAPAREPLHTPGPWRMNMGRTVAHIVGADGHGVCGVGTVGYKGSTVDEKREWRERAIANAHLIAAAPELLEACKAALGAFENNNAIDWGDLEHAIAKAEGRT